jgi:hypothetical protein
LQVLQRLLVVLDGALELLDVFGAALAEGSLGLAVALLALFRGGIDLGEGELVQGARARRLGVWRCGRVDGSGEAHGFATAFALLLLRVLLGIGFGVARLGGRGNRRRGAVAQGVGLAHGGRHICYATIAHVRAPYPSVLIEGHRSAKRAGDATAGRRSRPTGGSESVKRALGWAAAAPGRTSDSRRQGGLGLGNDTV